MGGRESPSEFSSTTILPLLVSLLMHSMICTSGSSISNSVFSFVCLFCIPASFSSSASLDSIREKQEMVSYLDHNRNQQTFEFVYILTIFSMIKLCNITYVVIWDHRALFDLDYEPYTIFLYVKNIGMFVKINKYFDSPG